MASPAAAPVTAPPAPAGAAGRLAGVGAVVFLANAGLLVLQLVAGRLLAPFVGSSLETWTCVIGAFLAGIALGNAAGGRLADRHPTRRALAAVLALGAVAAGWMVALPALVAASGAHTLVPLGPRIPVLAAALCFPPGFVLSLPTPLAIRLGLPDVRRAGRVAGLVFSLGTLGCLAGNYLTGFYLIPRLTVDQLVFATAFLLLMTAGGWLAVGGAGPEGTGTGPSSPGPRGHVSPPPRLPLPRAFAIVFLCSFAGMTLELSAARLLAQVLGVSLFTWTGVIGVMLAGTACGNWLGGVLADWAGRPRAAPDDARVALAGCLAAAGLAGVGVLLGYAYLVREQPFADLGLPAQVVRWTFALFFAPMLLLGTVSPQVIRLAVPDVARAGRTAGRVYAWSTAGAIAGTFATGLWLIGSVGMFRAILVAAALPAVAAGLAGRVWARPAHLYALSISLSAVVGGVIWLSNMRTDVERETNYFTIRVPANEGPVVREDRTGATLAAAAAAGPAGLVDPPGTVLTLQLDHLVHSRVRPADPAFLHYPHENIQLEFLRAEPAGRPRVLVIGGGGYTFPRAARTLVPASEVDVVEIDPGVTAVSYAKLGLDPALGVRPYHMDGRQYVAERAPAGHYHLVTLDAVNDLSVPAHLLTRECNRAVRRALAPDGVYLLTVIDTLEDGRLWKAAFHTLRETFPHVELLTAQAEYDPDVQQVYVLYASARPLDLDRVRATLAAQGVDEPYTRRPPAGELDRLLGKGPPEVLTDQWAPVDNMMADVFRRRTHR